MSLTPAVLDAMVASGCTAEQIAAAVKADLAEAEAKRESKRANNAERQRRYRERHAVTDDNASNALHGVTERDPPCPRPLPPQPPLTPTPIPPDINTRARKGRQIPDDWQPVEFNIGTKCREMIDGWPPGELETQVEHFTAHHRAKGTTSKDWQLSWKTWVLNSRKFGNGRNIRTSGKQGARSSLGQAIDEAIANLGG